ncbi:MAG: penicillin-binding protein 1A [Pseudomonadota bacterium]|nr:penicillin-binding protein 1A [Pseudomonadota bacterium]
MHPRQFLYPLAVLCAIGAICLAVGVLTLALLYPEIPNVDALRDYRPKVPLRIYTADDQLIGEFGEERREVLKLADVPLQMRHAILAAEDERFYSHGGIDWAGVFRAMLANVWARGAKEGASTITMQVARNFFLNNEKTFARKISEAMLAVEIERRLSKDQILELYLNQIYLGQRAYGFGAASMAYYGRPLSQLGVAEMAMLAGLPKAPSKYNPIVNPRRAATRQQYVLRRMHELRFISDAQFDDALKNPGHVSPARSGTSYSSHADYVAEMARQYMVETYGDAAYARGYRVVTTLRRVDQDTAWAAVRKGVLDYDRRHGYRGPEGYAELPAGAGEDDYEDALADREPSDNLIPAVVLSADPKSVQVYLKTGEAITVNGDGLRFARNALTTNPAAKGSLRRGALVRLTRNAKGDWAIAQLPNVEAAMVSLDPHDGAIRALVGGFDFSTSKFNHVTQAWRQPGSSFKPFIYSAAIEKGYTPATVMRDELATYPSADNGEAWEPHNYEPEYDGPIRLRVALAKSKNTVAVRLLSAITPAYAQQYITRFGFDARQHPAYLSMALGTGQVTPLQMGVGYCVFANGGYRVRPYFIDRIIDQRNSVISQARPVAAGGEAPVIDPRNAFLMTSMMKDVIRMGTATRAMSLGRSDLAGKTGTTSDHVDAWFSGFQPSVVAVAWIGFDTPASMGANETGAQAALPMWMDYMGRVLQGVPEAEMKAPEGLVQVMVDPATGHQDPSAASHYAEWFYAETAGSEPVTETVPSVPAVVIPGLTPPPAGGQPPPVAVPTPARVGAAPVNSFPTDPRHQGEPH